MKIEDDPRQTVDSDKINWVALQGNLNFEIVPGTFGVHSPAEPNAARGQRPGAFVRFRLHAEASWVEAPLGSLVAYGYPTDVEGE